MDLIGPSPRLGDLDALLSRPGLFDLLPSEIADIRVREIRHAVSWHRSHNELYGRYCDRSGFDPERIQSEADLFDVPVLPSALFKREGVSLHTLGDDNEDILPTTSSGTRGSISIVPRNSETLMRFFASIASACHELIGLDSFSLPLLNVGTPLEESEHLWAAYAVAGAAVFFASTDYVINDQLLVDQLRTDLASLRGERCAIIGPPATVLLAAERCGGVQLGSRATVVTVGGWKRSEGDAIDRPSFVRTVAGAFGIDQSRVRDAFSMVELNTAIFECEYGAKHIPPSLFAHARAARDLQACGDGESGILTYLDPTATSFPDFVLSDDFGTVARSITCPCGRRTDVLRLERRINRIESRGCALKMAARA